MTEKRTANYEIRKAELDTKRANVKQANRQPEEGGDVHMSVPGGHAAAVAATGSLVPDAAAAPAETIPIMTLPTETAVPFDWQSSPWEATNPPGRDDAGRVDWTHEWVEWSWKSQAKTWQ